MDELPFRPVGGLSCDEVHAQMDTFYVDSMPSGSESEHDMSSDIEDETAMVSLPVSAFEEENLSVSDSEEEDESENIPLSVLKQQWSKHKIPVWSDVHRPDPLLQFTETSGIPQFIKDIENPTPYILFKLFITDQFIDTLVFQTNLYAEQEKLSTGKTYLSTNPCEIKAFLGLNLLMGIKRSPSYKDYWSTAPELHDAFISSVMTQKRFGWLLSHLHLVDNSLMPSRTSPNYDKLYKIRPMMDLLLHNFEKCLNPDQVVVVDESMIKFKGRSSLKQYMPKKPIKRGYKIWMLADKTGYCLKFEMYTGKSSTGDVEKCLGARVVTNLIKHLQDKNHVLYIDNFFNSVELLQQLKEKKIHAVGTVNGNRRHMPKFKPDKSLKRGDMQWFTSDTSLLATKWKDKRCVHMLSNYHQPEDVGQVKRKEKNGQTIEVPCPQVVIDYNSNMNGVDIFDQRLSYYKIDRRSKKWWHRIFFYLLDASIVNSNNIYNRLKLPQISAKDFRRSVINGLLSETLVNPKRNSFIPSEVEIKKFKPYVPIEIRQQSSAHQPTRGTRRRCAVCSTKANPVRTDWLCSICKVPLCLGKNKDCFQNYHA